ncbi:MAG: small-conductance mechanosensitive ion channel [Massilia sp.]|nr:small-conductance mechanosensitive ion channel [Massilia sp.]
MQSHITNWSDAMMTSLAAAATLLLAAVPRMIGFAIIVIAGWFIASLIAKAVHALLRAVHFDVFAERAGVTGFVQKSNMKGDASLAIAVIVKWFVRLIALVVAFDALGLPAVSDVLRQLLMWLPNLVVALVVLVIGGIAAGALSNVVRGAAAEGGLERPDMLAKVAKMAVWVFAVVIAVNQLGIASGLINILFTAAVGAVAIALGLSFGLGGRDTAAMIVRQWYLRGQQQGPQIPRAADAAANQMNMLRGGAEGTERRSVATPDRRAGGDSGGGAR